MFKSKQPDLSKTDTLLGEGTAFEGRIKSKASIRIEGRVVGDIQCEGDLTVGEKAMVESNILARNITIAGKVKGDVTADSKLAITSSGQLFGNATSAAFTIEEGGIFTGSSRMTTGDGSKHPQDRSSKNEVTHTEARAQ